jgi:uncharacterized protein (TIGR02452 family)
LFEITPEKSTSAAARLHADGRHPTVLNFASATKPGGGYLTGARAQEEDLCRSSALYRSLLCAPEFHDWHRKHRDARYSHRLVWTPDVPVFRHADTHNLLATPYLTSFITAAAPNAGALATNHPAALPQVRSLLRERAARILALAAANRASTLVLGAWGCGVFKNDPADVANIFRGLLIGGPFDGHFEKVLFAVYDTSPAGETLRAFENAFPVAGNTTHIDPSGVRAAVASRSGGSAGAGSSRGNNGEDRRDRDQRNNGAASSRPYSSRDERQASPVRTSTSLRGNAAAADTAPAKKVHDSLNLSPPGRSTASTPSEHAAQRPAPTSTPASASSTTPKKPAKPTANSTLDAWLIRKPPPTS